MPELDASNSVKPLSINTDTSGFYKGYNRFVVLGAKLLIGMLVLWAGFFPAEAGAAL